MAIIGRLTIAILLASCMSLLLGLIGLAAYRAFPHWVITAFFVSGIAGLHFYVVGRSYLFMKKHWF